MKKISILFIVLIVLFFACLGTPEPAIDQSKLSTAFADHIMSTYPNPVFIVNKGWEYNTSIILHGMEKVYKKTKNPVYLEYIKKWVDNYVSDNGKVRLDRAARNLDYLHPGILLLFLWEETKEEKYKLAAEDIRKEFDDQPRNGDGGFWHKQRYPNEMWVDGIYMGEPFIMKYGALFGEEEKSADEATLQTLLIAQHTLDSRTNLLYHGWDWDKNAVWVDSKTGVSKIIWSRGMGWFAMALVDILEYLPKDHKDYPKILAFLNQVVEGLKKTQDLKTGLWYQVMDRPDASDNWFETSGSAMFVYAIKNAVDRGYIPADYLVVAEKGWAGVKTMVSFPGGKPRISGAVQGMGIKSSYKEYVSQSRLTNSAHGYAAILFASSAMEY
ncbi:MAG: glycoside hydrolase family 88 protein [Spirochaetales bacterium]|nr:glycoside hydrolase family 88 protein [Spirochaetales bacterium]